MRKAFLPIIVCALTFFAPDDSFAQKKRKAQSKDALVFTVVKFSSPGGGGMGNRLHSTKTFHFYASGRVACQSRGYDPRGKEIIAKKPNCARIKKAKIDKLLELAEQTDFLEAADSYQFFKGGVDYGKTLSITYLRRAGAKKIRLTNPRQAKTDAPLPPSVAAFLTEIADVDEALKVENEVRKN